jgi:hypothetical protein
VFVGEPLIEAPALWRAGGRHELRLGMLVAEVLADRRRLEDHEIAVDERRDSAVGIELLVRGLLVLLGGRIEPDHLVGRARFFHHGLRRHRRGAGSPVELVHRLHPTCAGDMK